jgi:catechol 2,3-dioxygenase-like lactoylglutathione lyase family enzyme
MAAVNGVHHTCFTVSDLDRSVAFYCDVLGCEVAMRQDREGGYIAAIVGHPDTKMRQAHLRAPGGQYMIELFEYLAPEGAKADVTPWNVGASHVCFLVDDLPALYERLRAEGVEFVSPPVEVDSGVNTGGYGVYLRDPDGITVELFQPPAGRGSE